MQDFMVGWSVWAVLSFKLFAALIVAVTANFLISRMIKFWIKKAQRTRTIWDNIILNSAKAPLRFYIWVLVLKYIIELLNVEFNYPISTSLLGALFKGVTLIFLAWFLWRFIRRTEKRYVDKFKKASSGIKDPSGIHALSKLCQVAVLIMLILAIMGAFNIRLSGLLAFGGISGAALAFSSKDMIGNLFGGFLIYFNRPFSIGDWISSPDRNIQGTVEDIGWRLTRIRTFDKRPLYVPNGIFSNIILENPSRMSNRRIKQNIGLRYDDMAVVKDILDDVSAMLKQHPDIDQSQTMLVYIVGFEAFSVTFQIYTFTKTTNWAAYLDVQNDVMLKVAALIHKRGADIAFPTQTLHIPEKIAVETV